MQLAPQTGSYWPISTSKLKPLVHCLQPIIQFSFCIIHSREFSKLQYSKMYYEWKNNKFFSQKSFTKSGLNSGFYPCRHLWSFAWWGHCISWLEEPAASPTRVYSRDLALAWCISVWLIFHKSTGKAALLSSQESFW